MIKKIAKNFIGLFLTILGIGIFGFAPMFASAIEIPPPPPGDSDAVDVVFENNPLFNEANFLPGESVARWVKVTNNSSQTQRIATEAIKVSDPDWLGAVLNLEIKKEGITLYSKPLSIFFKEGEVFLSNLASNSTATYNFVVAFYPGTQNSFQGKSLGFDILMGLQGTEGGILPGAGGGGGGYLPVGLTIQNESTKSVNSESATISWLTNYFSTSQIVYAIGTEAHILDLSPAGSVGTPAKYGYARTTSEYNAPANPYGVMNHSVTISGLTPGTTYYYRCISHGSFAVSTEHSFTTLTANEMKVNDGGVDENGVPITEFILDFPDEGGSATSDGAIQRQGGRGADGGVVLEPGQEPAEGASAEATLTETDNGKPGNLNSLLAGLVNFFRMENLWWLLLLAIIISFFLFWLFWREKKKKEQQGIK